MPLRVMGYDYATYKKQYNNNARQYKKQSAQQDARLDEHEFLSKMKKTDRLLPVVTIVIYYGEKVWDAATSLHGILDIPAEMAPYVNDYRMLWSKQDRTICIFIMETIRIYLICLKSC